jgi:presenilin-like A22 family membrane protease
MFDIILPSIVAAITIVSILLFERLKDKMKTLFEEREFRIRDAVFLVISMGAMVSIIVFVPQQAIRILFLVAYCFVLFLFTFVATERWYIAVLPSAVFATLYLSNLWNLFLLNAFAIIFAILVTVYLGGLFSWKTVLVFAVLITVMDFIQVFLTGFMGAAAETLVALELPILIQVPTFPREGDIRLGLGDIFLTGLLAIQTSQRYGRRGGFVSALAVGFAFFIFEIAIFSYKFMGYFPATLVVVGGWLLGLGVQRLFERKWAS